MPAGIITVSRGAFQQSSSRQNSANLFVSWKTQSRELFRALVLSWREPSPYSTIACILPERSAFCLDLSYTINGVTAERCSKHLFCSIWSLLAKDLWPPSSNEPIRLKGFGRSCISMPLAPLSIIASMLTDLDNSSPAISSISHKLPILLAPSNHDAFVNLIIPIT